MTRSTRKEQVRVDILTAAAGLLARNGYHGMSMRDLAAASGTQLANLYNYFASKEALLFALQSRAFESLIAASETAIAAAPDPETRLYAFIHNHVRFVAEHGDVMRVLVEEAGELPPEHRRAIRRLKERYYAIGHACVAAVSGAAAATPRRRRDALETERATYAIFGMLNWIYAWHQPRRHGSPQQVARSIHALAMGGLAAPVPARTPLAGAARRVERRPVPSPIALRERGIA